MPLPVLSLTSYAGLAAAGALIASSWRTIQGLLTRVADLFVTRIVVKEEAARAVLAKVWAEGSRSPLRLRIFGGTRSYVYPAKKVQVIGYETTGSEPMLVWFGRVPMVVGNSQWNALKSPPTQFNTQGDTGLVTIWCLRGTVDPDAFIQSAVTSYNELVSQVGRPGARRFNVIRLGRSYEGGSSIKLADEGTSGSGYTSPGSEQLDIPTRIRHKELRLLTWTPDELVERSSDTPPFDLYPYTAEQMSVLPEIESWMRSGDWCRTKGIPHRRGYLCWGQTGGGKSTFVRSLAIRFDLPLYVFDLSTSTNRTFARDWAQVQQNAPAIALIEDVDCVFAGRVNLTPPSPTFAPLTFDCLLNTISGVGTSDGVLLFVTTNDVSSLDSALGVPTSGGSTSTRPGRLDRTVLFGPMEETQRLKLASLILSDYPSLISPTVVAGEGEMPAQFQERCAQLALSSFWAAQSQAPTSGLTPLTIPSTVPLL